VGNPFEKNNRTKIGLLEAVMGKESGPRIERDRHAGGEGVESRKQRGGERILENGVRNLESRSGVHGRHKMTTLKKKKKSEKKFKPEISAEGRSKRWGGSWTGTRTRSPRRTSKTPRVL